MTLCPYPNRYLHLHRYQVLIEKEPFLRGVSILGECRRPNAAHTKECAEAQVGGGGLAFRAAPPCSWLELDHGILARGRGR